MTTSRTRLDGVQRRSRPRLFLAALWPATFLHQHRREPSVVQARAEANIALAGQQRFALWLAVANILHGWALAVQERPEAGLEQMQRGAGRLARGGR